MRPSTIAIGTIFVLGAINLVRGGIHLFAPDGGAASIAGLDLSGAPQTILFLFASLGAGQIGMGLVDIAAAARFRSFVPVLLGIHVIQLSLAVLALYVLKPPPTAVPGQIFNLCLLAAVAFTAIYEFGRRRRA